MLARFQHLSNESSSVRFFENTGGAVYPQFSSGFVHFFRLPEILQNFATNIHSDPRSKSPRSLSDPKKIDHFGPKTILQGHFEEHSDTLANMGYTNLQESTSWLSAPRSTKQLQKSWLCCRWHGCVDTSEKATRIRVKFKPPLTKNILRNPLRLGGGFKHLLFSPRRLGKMNPFWRAYFSKGLVQPPTRLCIGEFFVKNLARIGNNEDISWFSRHQLHLMSVWDIPGASHRIEEKGLKRCRASKPKRGFWETKRRVDKNSRGFVYGA